MKRSALAVCALAFAAMAAGPADAAFRVVKWKSGYCEIWNYDVPGKPAGATIMTRAHKSFARTLRSKSYLIRKKYCR